MTMDYKDIIFIVFGISSLVLATAIVWELTGIPKIHRKKYRIKIVQTRKGTTYYPQYRNYGWSCFRTLDRNTDCVVNVSYDTFEKAAGYIAKRKQLDEDNKETITYKYL